MDYIKGLLRTIFIFLDGIIYPLIGIVYNLLMDIANTNIFTEEIIDMFASKVYALLGIVMLFKVSFSILTYIVNPDEFSDKSKGFSKLISNVVMTLLLLVTTPWIFSQAMDIQRIILQDNIIGKIFSTEEVSNFSVLDAGNTMAYETLRSFYHVNDNITEQPNCEGLETGELTTDDACSSFLGLDADKFKDYRDKLQISYLTKDVSYYLDSDLANQTYNNGGKTEYVMTYIPLVSTLVGGFVGWILIQFCFDVAIRSIKLGFLRVIAPIPIISRIDPKKGNDIFNKWVKACVSTYLDLFIRLLAIYFAVFVIATILN